MSSFFLICSSNASLDKYPENTLAKFSNEFQERIELEGEYMLALQTINIANAIKKTYYKNTKIYVHIDIIFKHVSVFKHHSLLRIVNLNNTDGTHIFHSVKRKEYFPVKPSELTRITIKLCDVNGDLINFLPGQATVVKLKIKKMNQRSSFILQLSSFESRHLFKENNCVSFTNNLSYPIQLDKNWYVALSTIMIPKDILPSTKVEDFIFKIVDDEEKIYLNIDFEKSDFKNLESIQSKIMSSFRDNEHVEAMFSKSYNGRLMFRTNTTNTLYIKTTALLGIVLGNSQEGILIEDSLMKIKLKQGRSTVMSHVPDLRKLYHNMILIYCDIVEPINLGNKRVQIIEMIPLIMKPDESYISYECENHDFLKILTSFISNITIELRSIEGDLIPFGTTKDSTHVCLLFKRKK